MHWLLDLIGQAIPALAMGILAGQKLRITLGGNKIPVKVPSRKATGKSGTATKAAKSAPAQSLSVPDLELPYISDRPS